MNEWFNEGKNVLLNEWRNGLMKEGMFEEGSNVL